jgi:SAM-dependent methyltransferase
MSRRELVIGAVGLGYVGLAYALGFSLYGFRIVCVDIDGERVKSIENGLVNGFSREALLKVIQNGSLKVSTSYEVLGARYEVVAFDVEPEPYVGVAESCGVKVVRCDLERDDLGVAGADCAVFSEVLEHLHYYYAPAVLAKISRALKPGGVLVLTTPNVASLFRRLRLLLGRQPRGREGAG